MSKEDEVKRLFVQTLRAQLEFLDKGESLESRLLAMSEACRVLLADLRGKPIPARLFPGAA